MWTSRPVLAAVFLWIGGGCTARQLERDGANLRAAMCDLYTEQAMDNLIRAKTCQPFVQVGYRDLLAQTTDDLGGNVDGSTALQRQTGPVAGIMRQVTTGVMGGVKGNRQRQLSFHADPLVDRPEVYEMYITFAQDPALFVESDGPPACPVHLHRQRHKKHYWVPCEAAPMFQALVLRTSFQPPAEAATSPAYDVEIDQVVRVTEVDPKNVAGRAGLFTVVLKLKTPVPNGDGYLILEAGGKQLRAEVLPLLPGNPATAELAKDRGLSIEYVQVQYRPTDAAVQPAQLQGLKGRFFSFEYPKVMPPTRPPVIQQLRDDVDRLRANVRPR